ncbi:MAG: ion transporter [Bradymonadaceae bacterium]
MPTGSTIRRQIWRVLNDPEDPRYHWFLWGINILILSSFGMLAYEVLGQPTETELRWLHTVDRVILGIFLVEYIARLAVIRRWRPASIELSFWQTVKYFAISRLRFMLSPWGLIDLVALLPIFPFLRSLRILRLLRLFRSTQVMRPVQGVFDALRNNSLLFAVAFGFVAVSIVLSATMLFFAEFGVNPGIDSMTDTLWWAIVTISTVGFGDITPQTAGGRVIGAALMISGMLFIAMLAGVISSTLVDHLLPLRNEQVRMSSTTDHIIILGWNENVPMLLDQLDLEFGDEDPPLMVLAPRPRPEALDTSIPYVEGDFTKESELDKVRLSYARTVLAVADNSSQGTRSQGRDATTILAVFTTRSRERQFEVERTEPLHICAEILDPENIEHALSSGANEVIPSSLLGYGAVAHSAGNPGIGEIVTNLVLSTRHNLYTSEIPMRYIQGETMRFRELQNTLQEDYEIMLLGYVRGDEFRLNPPRPTDLRIGDELIYIGDERIEDSEA